MESPFQVDLTNCDREPIHIPGQIQSHGFLLALNPSTLRVEKISANLEAFTGITPSDLIGQHLSKLDDSIMSTKTGSSLVDLLRLSKITGNFDQLNPQKVTVGKNDMLLICHHHKGQLICEFEPIQSDKDDITLQKIMSTALTVIQSAVSFTSLLEHVARLVREISGYNRIMIYKFHKDQHGEVIAEARDPDIDSWLHLHYPASDIPAQARELYKLNLVRMIADVNGSTADLLSDTVNTSPLDLTHSTLRAVSPIHIEYLKNMQVGASFSISLMSKNELWGLIACHNKTSRFIDYNSRIACKFIGQLFSAALEFKNNEVIEEKINQYTQNQLLLFEQLMKKMNPVEALVDGQVTLLDINSAEGVVFCYESKLHKLGKVPEDKDIDIIVDLVKNNEENGFFQTSSLARDFPQTKTFSDIASGIMATEISHMMSEFIIWFKAEKLRKVDWAGDQQKNTMQLEDGSVRISPRKSFAKWTEEVKYTADEWTDLEISAAMKLREDLIQVISKKASEIRKLNELLKEAYEELDTFSFTISHDLRTPLSSIKNYTEIILEDHGHEFSDQSRDLFNKVIRGTNKMAGLIKDVLQYSRVGRTDMQMHPIDMKKMIEEIREELLLPLGDKKIEFIVKNTPAILGDKTMLMQLFTNLIGNAVKYSTGADRQQEALVVIDGEIKDDFVEYTIADNGIGIDMRYANRIFELFRRLDNVKNIEGTGVGLAIAKRIVEKHQGKIWLESKLNHGTKFYIDMPVKQSENA